jgi:ribosomal protein S18 acetylase RimI-like enzyme
MWTTSPTVPTDQRNLLAVATTAKPFAIRPGTVADAGELAAIGRRMFAFAHADAFLPEDLAIVLRRDWDTAVLEAELSGGSMQFFVAEVERVPVGLTALRPGDVPNSKRSGVELCRVYLDSEHFGKGIGAALLDAAVHHADGRGYGPLWLIAWQHNDRAIPMYHHRGFVETARFPYAVGRSAPTAVLMERARP